MISIIIKVFQVIKSECHIRGTYHAILMNLTHIFGIIRALWFKILYPKNIKCSIFSLQANSRIDIFNRNSKLNIGEFVFIRKNASIRLDFNGVLDIKEKVFINDNCTINCVNKISIGQNTKIAPNVCINDHDHNYKNIEDGHLLKGEVIIGNNVWIGANVVILRNTFIGDNAVIGAGSIVKGKVPPNTIFVNKRENTIIKLPDSNKYNSNDVISV
jgi:acetyltransferase-like isoleucine patch superfamily enzyme